jgi:hypothetical protein
MAGRQAGRQATASISYNMNKTSKSMVANKFQNQNPAQTMRRCSSMHPRGSGFCFLKKFTTLVTSYNVHHYYCIHQFVKLAQYQVYTELLGCWPLKAICETSTIYKSWFSVHVIISRSQLLDLNLFI